MLKVTHSFLSRDMTLFSLIKVKVIVFEAQFPLHPFLFFTQTVTHSPNCTQWLKGESQSKEVFGWVSCNKWKWFSLKDWFRLLLISCFLIFNEKDMEDSFSRFLSLNNCTAFNSALKYKNSPVTHLPFSWPTTWHSYTINTAKSCVIIQIWEIKLNSPHQRS